MADLFKTSNYFFENKSIRQIKNDFDNTYKELFENTKKAWLGIIRDFLREKTGLRIDKSIPNVQIAFVSDCNNTLVSLADKYYPELDFNEYFANTELYEALRNSKLYYQKKDDLKLKIAHQELEEYLNKYFEKYRLNNIANTLFNKDNIDFFPNDLLGVYHLNSSNIEIFFLPIILFCRLFRLNLEACLVLVLVHEYAHRVLHIGQDKDHYSWVNMRLADSRIVEGLAEYYTYQFASGYEHKLHFKKVYDKLLIYTPKHYLAYMDWLNFSSENISFAMISARRKNIVGYDRFLEDMGKASAILDKK